MARTLIFMAFVFGVVVGNLTCTPRSSVDVSVDAERHRAEGAQPSIELVDVEKKGGHFLLTGGTAELAVSAPGASRWEIFYMPVTSSDRALRLTTIEAAENGRFSFRLNAPEDLNGEVWARVHYPNGEVRETERVRVARRDTASVGDSPVSPSPRPEQDSGVASPERGTETATTDTDDSARADKLTGGKIERASLKRGGGEMRVTVNVPAFLMTLWQDGKEIETYYVGVGRKQYPIPSGMRTADQIILNPDWIPPNSEWVRQSEHEPYERIPASDPDNPLGKIKIPLGDAYLLHEAQGPSDIGNLVSHGCVRVLRDDIFDMTKRIAAGWALGISASEIEAARRNTTRRPIDLNGEMQVDINYDTMVVEGGELQIFPDVYEKGVNTVDNLKKELENYGVGTGEIPRDRLEELLAMVSRDRKVVIPLANLKAGRFDDHKVEPLIPQR